MRFRYWTALIAFCAMPALAQQTTTGPGGLAEPRVKLPKNFPLETPPPVVPKAEPENILDLDLSTGGRVEIQLRPDKAPLSVERIKALTRRGFYNGLIFHRVIEGFMAQTGDPKGTGEGGSELPDVKAEFNDLPHVRGAVAMARAKSPDSANSQFYIMLMPNLKLDNNYTVIGRVLSGIQYVDTIEKGEPPANPSKIVRASIASDGVAPPPPMAPTASPAAPVTDAPATAPGPEAAPAPNRTPGQR